MTAMMTKLPCKDGVSAQGNFQIMLVPHICGHVTYMSFFCEKTRRVKSGQTGQCSCKSSADIASTHIAVLKPHIPRTLPFWYGSSMEIIEGSASLLAREAHVSKATTPKKRRRKKKTYTTYIVHVSLNGLLLFLPQTSGFSWFLFTQLIDICVKNSQVLIIHRFLFTTKKMVKPHGGTT